MSNKKKQVGLFSKNTLIFCAVGLLINLFFSRLMLIFGFPLYLDSAGTILTAALCGGFPGITVAAITSTLNSGANPDTIYYGVLAILIAFLASEFSRKRWFKKKRGFIGAAFIFSLIGGGLGSVTTWLLSNGIGDTISRPYVLMLLDHGLSGFGAQFTADMIIDIIDKMLSMIPLYIFTTHYPKKLYNAFPISYMYDRSEKETLRYCSERRTHYRTHSLNVVLAAVICLSLIAFSFVSSLVSVTLNIMEKRETYTIVANNTSRHLSKVISDSIHEYNILDYSNSDVFDAYEKKFQQFIDNTTGLNGICIYLNGNGGFVPAYDFTKKVPSDILKQERASCSDYLKNSVTSKDEESEPVFYYGKNGMNVIDYYPIYSTAGNINGYVCVYVELYNINNSIYTYFIRMLTVQMGILIWVLSYIIWYTRDRIVYPISVIVNRSLKFKRTDPETWLLENHIDNASEIETGDELEELYKTICRVEHDVAENIMQIKKSQDIKRQNAELSEEVYRANEASKAKSQFFSQMSHDIRTPLNAIVNITELAKDDIHDEERITEDLNKISMSGNFLRGLIDDILDMSKIETGKIELHPSVYKHSEFRSYIDSIIAPLCAKKGIEFKLVCKQELPIVYVDKIRINRVFFNLLSNATSYTPEGGTVSLIVKNVQTSDTALDADYVISDTGIGMSEEFQKKMFMPFERADTTSAYKGTGLGLTIAKSIVDAMGGTITVNSVLGKGTDMTVHLSLPIATREQLAEAGEKPTETEILKDKRVLVVEDNKLNREIIGRLLKRRGMILDYAEDGSIAVDKFSAAEAGYYNVILMDIRMSVMDGFTATKIIRETDKGGYEKRIPIIAMTADVFSDKINELRASGMDDYIAKPIDPQKTYEILAKHLEDQS